VTALPAEREIAITEKPISPLMKAKMVVVSFFGWLSFLVSTFVFAIVGIVAGSFDSTGSLGHRISARAWARSVLTMVGVRIRLKGIEHLDPKRGYILTANHLSLFDILVLLAGLPLQFRWMAKKEVFQIPLMGWAMKRVGYVSIDRENKEKAWESVYAAKSKLDQGFSLMFFPEGTRSPDGEMKRFKSGAFVLSLHAGVPVVPISIVGTREIMPKKSVLFHPGTVDIVISPPIEPDAFTLDRKEEFAQVVRGQIAVELEKTRLEREQRAAASRRHR
jgi:1-acyl-sn-glycerol-3-phosphate acyltransferase